MWLKYAVSRGFPIPNSKMEILDHFFDAFFDEWEIPKIHERHPSFIKKQVLLRLAQFLFEKKEYLFKRGEFEQFFYQTWNKLLKENTGIGDPESALEVLIHHGLITPKGYYIGFAVPLYRDYFLIKGMEKPTFTSQEKQQLAEICIELNFDLKAKELYWEAAFDPGSTTTTKITATLFFKKQGELEKAAKIIASALPLRTPVPYHIYALILKDLGRYEEAENQFKKGIEVDSKNAPLYQAYALMLKEMGRFEDAASQMKQLLKINTEVKYKITFLNILFYCLNRTVEAESLVNQILQKEKIKGKIRGNLNLTRKLIEWRKDYLNGRLEAIENRVNLYRYAGELMGNNNFKVAETILKELYHQQPSDFFTCQLLGRTLIKQKNREGIQFLEKAMELNPDPPRDILYQILHAALAVEHYDWTQNQLDSFLQKEPENYKFLRLQAISLAKKDQYEEAREIYKKAYSLTSTIQKRTTILREQARMLIDQGSTENWRQAGILLEKAWVLEPQNPVTFRMRQELNKKMNQPFEKKSIYQLIKERLEPGDIIEVKLQGFNKNKNLQCFYYGVPCNLPWHEIAETYEPFETVQAVFSRLNEKGELNLEWSESILQN
jgi:tetratricopeptide (TPR) repeat protein